MLRPMSDSRQVEAGGESAEIGLLEAEMAAVGLGEIGDDRMTES